MSSIACFLLMILILIGSKGSQLEYSKDTYFICTVICFVGLQICEQLRENKK